MVKRRLTADELRVLRALTEEVDHKGEGALAFAYWSTTLGQDFTANHAALQKLKRKGFVTQKGRGKWADYWATWQGIEQAKLHGMKPKAVES